MYSSNNSRLKTESNTRVTCLPFPINPHCGFLKNEFLFSRVKFDGSWTLEIFFGHDASFYRSNHEKCCHLRRWEHLLYICIVLLPVQLHELNKLHITDMWYNWCSLLEVSLVFYKQKKHCFPNPVLIRNKNARYRLKQTSSSHIRTQANIVNALSGDAQSIWSHYPIR